VLERCDHCKKAVCGACEQKFSDEYYETTPIDKRKHWHAWCYRGRAKGTYAAGAEGGRRFLEGREEREAEGGGGKRRKGKREEEEKTEDEKILEALIS